MENIFGWIGDMRKRALGAPPPLGEYL